MIYAKIDVDIIDHPKALDAGRDARELWVWSILYSRKHETDGFIPMSALLATAWGRTGKANVKVAERLIVVGLWERVEGGFAVQRYADKNETKAQIDERRHGDRERKKVAAARPPAEQKASKRRAPENTQEELRWDSESVPSGIPDSDSPSDSGASDLSLEIACSPVAPAPAQDVPLAPASETRSRPTLTVVSDAGPFVGARPITAEEQLTRERTSMFDAVVFGSAEALVAQEVWRDFVDDRLKRGALVLSEGALDADWRLWVRRQIKWEKQRRVRAREFRRSAGHIVQPAIPGSWKAVEGFE